MKVTDKWQSVLENGGYERHCTDKADYLKIKRLSRMWRRVLNFTGSISGKALEVGCGGANQLVPLAVNGWECYGLDCSPEVLKRAERYIREVELFYGKKLNINLYCGDWLSLPENHPLSLSKYDLVFNVGVIEHYLDPDERRKFLSAKLTLTKPGGYVVSVVPSGLQPFRKKMKQGGLAGYCVPETDYTPELLLREMNECGASEATVLPHNILGYYPLIDQPLIPKWAVKFVYYLVQVIPVRMLPREWAEKHAYSFIAICRKR